MRSPATASELERRPSCGSLVCSTMRGARGSVTSTTLKLTGLDSWARYSVRRPRLTCRPMPSPTLPRPPRSSWPTRRMPAARSVSMPQSFRTCGPVCGKGWSARAQRAQVATADRQALERVAAALVLLDDQPLDARLVARGQHVGPVQVALADLGHDRQPLADVHVLHVDRRGPAPQPADPRRRAAAAELHPVRVDLAVEQRGVARLVEDLQAAVLPVPLHLVGVVVVRQPDAGLVQPRRHRRRRPRELRVTLRRTVLLRHDRHGHVGAAPRPAVLDHRVRLVAQPLPADVRRAGHQARLPQQVAQPPGLDRTQAGKFDALVAHVAHAGQSGRDRVGVPQVLAQRVELGRDHLSSPSASAVPRGMGAGRSHVLSTSTCRPRRADSTIDCITSSTWWAMAPEARGCRPSRSASARSTTPRPRQFRQPAVWSYASGTSRRPPSSPCRLRRTGPPNVFGSGTSSTPPPPKTCILGSSAPQAPNVAMRDTSASFSNRRTALTYVSVPTENVSPARGPDPITRSGYSTLPYAVTDA